MAHLRCALAKRWACVVQPSGSVLLGLRSARAASPNSSRDHCVGFASGLAMPSSSAACLNRQCCKACGARRRQSSKPYSG